MELTKKYIEQVLKFNDHFFINDGDDVEIVDIIRTRGNVGFFVKWNTIYHFTGGITNNFDYQFISNYTIRRRFDYDFKTFNMNARKKKLLLIQLNNEMNEKG